jgi:hypothetical protein
MNVRWDRVADRDVAERIAPRPLRSRFEPQPDGGRISVKVQLFGALASLAAQRSLNFELPAGANVADALAMAGQHLGAAFLSHVLDDGGAKRRYCRTFLRGYAVEDLQTPLGATVGAAEIDIILLIAPEGG